MIMRLQAILLALIRAVREMRSPIVYRGNVPYLRHPASYSELPDWHAFHDHVAGYSRRFFRRTHGDDLNSDALDAIIQARYSEAVSDADDQRMSNEHNLNELYRLRHAKLLEVRNEYGVLNRMKQQYENEIALLDRREEAYLAALNQQRQQPVPAAAQPEPAPQPTPTVAPEPVHIQQPATTVAPEPVHIQQPAATVASEPVHIQQPAATVTPEPVHIQQPAATVAPEPVHIQQPAATVAPEPVHIQQPAATVTPEPVHIQQPAATVVQPEPTPIHAPESEIREPLPPTLAKKPKPEALPPTIVHTSDRTRAAS